MGIFVFAHMVQHGLELAASFKGRDPVVLHRSVLAIRAVAAGVLSVTLILLLCSAYQFRIQQEEIELGNRKAIGLWLRAQAASPKDSVFLEPLGYISYYSQLKMLDIPGLSAPEVVGAIKHIKSTSRARLIPELKPDWLVLRKLEAEQIRQASPRLLTEDYSEVKVFDASSRVAAHRWLPGRGYLNFDEIFIVFKRVKKTDPDSRSGT